MSKSARTSIRAGACLRAHVEEVRVVVTLPLAEPAKDKDGVEVGQHRGGVPPARGGHLACDNEEYRVMLKTWCVVVKTEWLVWKSQSVVMEESMGGDWVTMKSACMIMRTQWVGMKSQLLVLKSQRW